MLDHKATLYTLRKWILKKIMRNYSPTIQIIAQETLPLLGKLYLYIKGRAIRNLAAPALTIALVGCGEDSNILKTRDYSSKIYADAAVIFPAISNDILQSCLREASYRSLVRNSPIDSSRSLAKQNCELNLSSSAASTSQSVDSIHKLITSYLKSLAGLSEAKITDYSKEVTTISSSLKTLPGLSSEDTKKTVDAATTIGNYLISFATSSYQKKTLKEIVVSTDTSLSQLVYALSTALNLGYIGSKDRVGLQQERESLDDYYGQVIRRSLAKEPRTSFNDYMEVRLNNEWILSQNQIDQRRLVALQYLSLLKRIACDHTRLRLAYEGRSDVKAEDVNTLCKNVADGGLQGLTTPQFPDSLTVRNQAGMSAAVMYSLELSRLKAKVAKTYSLETPKLLN
jgi:hypothetical protein